MGLGTYSESASQTASEFWFIIQSGSQSCVQTRIYFKVGPKVASKLEGQLKVGTQFASQPGCKRQTRWETVWDTISLTCEFGNNFGTHFEMQSSLETTLGPTLNCNRVCAAFWEALFQWVSRPMGPGDLNFEILMTIGELRYSWWDFFDLGLVRLSLTFSVSWYTSWFI